MRKQNKIVLWPAYFDSTKTRLKRRRVPKSLATPSPKLEEIQKAVEMLGLQPEKVRDAVHPNAPWQKTGLIMVPKEGPKTETVRKIAKKLKALSG